MTMSRARCLLLAASIAMSGIGVAACSSNSDSASSEPAVPTVTGSDASVVVLVDCGEDGVASIDVAYGPGPAKNVLVGRNPTTLAAGGVKTFSSNYDTEPGFDDATLTVTTTPTRGTCMTSLTDYNSGDIIGERLTAGKVMLKAVISAGG